MARQLTSNFFLHPSLRIVNFQNMDTHAAAVRIQKVIRGFLWRRRLNSVIEEQQMRNHEQRQAAAATAIQALARGHLQRQRQVLPQLRQQNRESYRKDEAAVVIQQTIRSALSRTQLHQVVERRHQQWNGVKRAEAAAMIQRVWRSKRLLLTAVAQTNVERRERNASFKAHSAMAENQERAVAAGMIQREYMRAAAMRAVRTRRDHKVALLQDLAHTQEVATMQKAAAAIQRMLRKVYSERLIGELRSCRQAEELALRQDEASSVLQRIFSQLKARRRLERHRSAVVASKERTRQQEAATCIQAALRGKLQRKRFVQLLADLKVQREFAASRCIQCMYRRWKAQRCYDLLAFDRTVQRDRAALREAAVMVQRIRRGQLGRRCARQKAAMKYLSLAVTRIGRAFIARFQLGRFALECASAPKLQRIARKFLAAREHQRRKAAEARRQKTLKNQQAALIVQRNWLRHAAQKEFEERRTIHRRRSDAARVIQREGRCLIAKSRLRNLKEARQDELFFLDVDNGIILIQSVVRRFLATMRVSRIRSMISKSKALITGVFAGYASRRILGITRDIVRTKHAAEVIQLGWRQCIKMRLARDKTQQRREYISKVNREKNAATLIQSKVKGYLQRNMARKLQQRREVAALKIERRARMFLAKRRADMLRQKVLEHRCARKIQVRWDEVKEGVRERRMQREMEWRLVEMDFVAIRRSEDFHRKEICGEEDDSFAAALGAFRREVQALHDAAALRLATWRERAPMELQEVAAIKLQAVFRGTLARMRSRCLNDEESPRRVRSGLVPPVKLPNVVAGGTKGSKGSEMLQWLSWLAVRPEVNKRSFERLLQREAASRRRIIEEERAEMFGGAPVPQPSPRSQLPPLQKPHGRHLTALAGASALSRRANALLSQHSGANDTTATVSTAHRSRVLDVPLEKKVLVSPDLDGVVDLSRRDFLTEALLRPILHDLRHNASLKELNLRGLTIRDLSAIDIADLLNHTKSLRTLSLANTSLSDIGMSHILSALKRNLSVEFIDISGTNVSERYRSHLSLVLQSRQQSSQPAPRRVQPRLLRNNAVVPLKVPPILPYVPVADTKDVEEQF